MKEKMIKKKVENGKNENDAGSVYLRKASYRPRPLAQG
jgi:hypothetical protein